MRKKNSSADAEKEEIKRPHFSPAEYRLSDAVFKIPINEVGECRDGGDPQMTPTTVGEAFKRFNGWIERDGDNLVNHEGEPIGEIHYSYLGTLSVETPSVERRFSGTPSAAHLLYVLLTLRKDGINPYAATWFFYDKSWSRDANESFGFFVVCDSKIVNERIIFFWSSYPKDGRFDLAALFDGPSGEEPIWSDDDGWEEAQTAFWYRKFYTDTKTGQLMALRPDKPILYYYQRPETRDAVRDLELVILAKLYRLFLVTVPLLGAIAFPSFRGYLGIAAAAFGAEYLLGCWRTRKVGKA
jgi:hypothetical protein